MVGAVQPFDMTAAIPFKNQYLSGFLTEKRDIEFPDMKENVEREFRQYADGLMESTIIGYTSVSNLQSNQQIKISMKITFYSQSGWLLIKKLAMTVSFITQ